MIWGFKIKNDTIFYQWLLLRSQVIIENYIVFNLWRNRWPWMTLNGKNAYGIIGKPKFICCGRNVRLMLVLWFQLVSSTFRWIGAVCNASSYKGRSPFEKQLLMCSCTVYQVDAAVAQDAESSRCRQTEQDAQRSSWWSDAWTTQARHTLCTLTESLWTELPLDLSYVYATSKSVVLQQCQLCSRRVYSRPLQWTCLIMTSP